MDQVRRNRVQEENDTFQKLVGDQAQNLPRNDRGIFQAFANLGRQVNNVVSGNRPGQLTDDEKRKFSILARSNELIKQVQSTDDFKAAAPEEQAIMTQDAMARAAGELGDPQVQANIMLQNAKLRLSFKQANAQLAATEESTRGNKQSRQFGAENQEMK
ncbi:MAG: hypothetical protein ACRDL7_12990, partial [Gaiellaceae bacterium]